MVKEDLIPYLTKFVVVKLKDGTIDAGYISNHEDIKNTNEEDFNIVLLNGLLQSEVKLSSIQDIKEANREDTTKIPIVGFDDSVESYFIDPVETENKINELYESSLLDDLDIDLESLLKKEEETNE